MNSDIASAVAAAIGREVTACEALGGGCIGEVHALTLEDDSRVVAKRSPGGGLSCEAWMLGYLAERSALPVPAVLYSEDELLIMTYTANDSGVIGDLAQTHAAELLAELHGITAQTYGLERDTLIGGLQQPNKPSESWLSFFTEQRLAHFSRLAYDQGALTVAALARVERICARIDEFLDEPERPSLIHGDVWTGNVLVCSGRIAGFVDPAIYYADAEIELAFSTLFSTFGDAFFSRYQELRPIAPGFFEVRRDLYNLYPLLVHAVLFGGGYGAQADATLRRLVGV